MTLTAPTQFAAPAQPVALAPTIAPHRAGSGSTTVRAPGFSATAPRELVHRAAISEVFVTDWESRGGDTYELAAQWPRCHSFFTPPSSSHHMPSLVAETIRQSVFVLAHAEYGIPFGHAFVMNELSYRTSRAGIRVGSSPADVQLLATCTEFTRKGRRVAGFRTEVTLLRDGRPFAAGSASFTAVAPAVYRRLRGAQHRAAGQGPHLPAPVCPEYVGRSSALDVVLAPTDRRDVWHVRADTSHPTMFDHPVDHVPGMVLLEAACQAAAAASHPGTFHALRVHATFARYAEYDSPCVLTADHRPESGFATVTGTQAGQLVFTATLGNDTTLDSYAAPDRHRRPRP
ncbi:hypothetical protein MTQ01_00860 [Streptomyces sp. XM4193]|uniref:ScbA/BarX family gamma-butyrolactone biosynthesis protein n=1 Tax=Streptomyces sp. XM4193 TaxID=2929782 RepID=UPI001FFAB351|nr:ScbA/BarX family gamma-butyrolactone biosynthesis protein [Streptomyces sp. XM4193]MCK1794599.1 hypothetical protein [Streptomyces sp. XM4193]